MNEIAEQMAISPSTVKDAVQRICRKLNAEGSAHAVAEAFRRRLLQ